MSAPSERKPCSEFKPQKWRDSVCATCFHKREDHPQFLLEKHVGEVRKDDPTEVFELLDMIGSGSYGYVFMARDASKQELYAIKFLELEKKENEIASIANEINIMKQSIECPYIVEYQGCYTKGEYIMVVMEWCCCSVEDVLAYCDQVKFTETQIAAVSAAVVKGLAYLHACGIAHRDIKSGNILLKESGEVKLADFGVSHKLQNERDKMKTLAGSPYWCAPELITADSYDNRVDIWATGICAIEMAQGRPPHWEMDPLQVIFHIPKMPPPRLKQPEKWSKDFQDFLDACLRKNPAERPSAKELLCHPFILRGSSSQILAPLVKECLPIITPKKKAALEQEENENNEEQEEDEEDNKKGKAENSNETTFVKKGTILAIDKSTHKVDVLGAITAPPPTPAAAAASSAAPSPTSPATKNAHNAPSPSSPSTKNANNPSPSSPSSKNANHAPAKQSVPKSPSTGAMNQSSKKNKFFGVPIADSVKESEKSKKQHIVDVLINYMVFSAIDVEGIFRVSGDYLKIRDLKQKFEEEAASGKGTSNIKLESYNIHDVAGLFKLYFRELPECLLTYSLYPSFIVADQIEDPEGRKQMIKSLIDLLPEPNKKILAQVVRFLNSIASHAKKNLMNAANLGRCLGAALMFQKDDAIVSNSTSPSTAAANSNPDAAKDTVSINRLLKTLIEQHSEFF